MQNAKAAGNDAEAEKLQKQLDEKLAEAQGEASVKPELRSTKVGDKGTIYGKGAEIIKQTSPDKKFGSTRIRLDSGEEREVPNPVFAKKWQAPPAPQSATEAKGLLTTEQLPDYAKQAVLSDSAMRRTNEGGGIHATDPYAGISWREETVPLESLKPGNEMLWGGGRFKPRGSMMKGADRRE